MKRFLHLVLPALVLLVIGALPANARLAAQLPGSGFMEGSWELTIKSTRYWSNGEFIGKQTLKELVTITDVSGASSSDLFMTTFWAFLGEYPFGFLPLTGNRHGYRFFLKSEYDNGVIWGQIKMPANSLFATGFTATAVNEGPLNGLVYSKIKARRPSY